MLSPQKIKQNKKSLDIIQFSSDILVFSKFKHLQNSSCILADSHCLQVAPALHKSLWPKKEKICNRIGISTGVLIQELATLKKMNQRRTYMYSMSIPGAVDHLTDPSLPRHPPHFYYQRCLHQHLCHHLRYSIFHRHHHFEKDSGNEIFDI